MLLLLLVSCLGLTFGSRLIILTLPLIAQEFFSSYPAQWGTDFHYWLPIAPILFMGAADGLRNIAGWLGQERRLALVGGVAAAALVVSNLIVARDYPLWDIVSPGISFSATSSDRAAQRALDVVPSGASATVPAAQLPHMSRRNDIYLFGYPSPQNQYVVFAPGALGWPDPTFERQWLAQNKPAYRTVYDRDGWVVWQRKS